MATDSGGASNALRLVTPLTLLSMSAPMSCNTRHFDTIYALLPASLKCAIDDMLSGAASESAMRHTLDQLVRFSLSMDCGDDDLDSREAWNTQRQKVQKALSSLSSGAENGKKRERENTQETSDCDPKAKKLKMDPESDGGTDVPIFSLHAVSASAPVRKKVHITIHQNTVRFANATSGAQEASIPLTALTRAFCISTPGKSKPHWTVIILTDVEQNQIIFGLDAVPPSLTTTTHPASPNNHPKGTQAKPLLTQFFSHLPSRVILQEPSTSQFRSATGEPFLDAYLRAKDGHLLFFNDGILFGEKKPCMWIAMEEIDSVRCLSATGRTFSLYVRYVGESKEADQEEDTGEEIEFSLIDGKNQDSVARWVHENRHRFGVSPRPTTVLQNGTEVDELAADEDTPEKKADGDSDGDDSDFESESESDGGSATSDSSNDDDQEEEADAQGSGSDEDGEGEEEEEEEGQQLDPSKHPLLREGAMPKMSMQAINAVVGMVEEDLRVGSAPKGAQVIDDGEDVDELED